MNKIEQQFNSIEKSRGNLNLDFIKKAEEMEEKLKRMGIELQRQGPLIEDPAHTRGRDY